MPRNASFRVRALLVALVALPCAGCADMYYDRRDAISLGAGDAVASNKIAQMVDPWPAAAANKDISYNGERMQRAAERYRTGRTTPLATTSTSSAPYTPSVQPGANAGGAGVAR